MSETTLQTYGWDWSTFLGSAQALKWNRRDIATLDAALAFTRGRTAAVQAGGNLGIFPKYLARFFETVYTFEPDPEIFRSLCANAPEPNVVKFQAAVGDRRGLVGLAKVRRDGKPEQFAHEGITHVSGAGVVPTLMVDDLALPVCDLLVVDIEGWELYALRGASQTITFCRPVIVVEVNKNSAHYGIAPDDVRDTITGLGYRLAGRYHSDEIFVPAEAA